MVEHARQYRGGFLRMAVPHRRTVAALSYAKTKPLGQPNEPFLSVLMRTVFGIPSPDPNKDRHRDQPSGHTKSDRQSQ